MSEEKRPSDFELLRDSVKPIIGLTGRVAKAGVVRLKDRVEGHLRDFTDPDNRVKNALSNEARRIYKRCMSRMCHHDEALTAVKTELQTFASRLIDKAVEDIDNNPPQDEQTQDRRDR